MMHGIISKITYFADSLFLGTKFLVPVLFIAWLAGSHAWKQKLKLPRDTCNILILSGGILFLTVITVNLWMSWYTNNEADRDLLISVATGPGWFQLVTPLLNYGILPMLLWNRKLRESPYTSFIIVTIWITSWFWVDYFTKKIFGNFSNLKPFAWEEYLEKGCVFFITFTLLMLLLNRIRQGRNS